MNKRIAIGSQVFFNQFEDYESHDKDFIEFQDNPVLYKTFMHARGKSDDIFFYKSMNKDEFIAYELEKCKTTPMAAGKFLIPELCKYFNITIDDLRQFQYAFDNIDDKHEYERIIFNAYIENGDFVLTDEQRNEAYQLYKEIRK